MGLIWFGPANSDAGADAQGSALELRPSGPEPGDRRIRMDQGTFWRQPTFVVPVPVSGLASANPPYFALISLAAKNPSRPERLGSSPHRWQGRVRRSPEGVRHSARPPISLGSIATRRASGLRRSSALIWASPSSGSSEHVQ